MSFNKRIYSAVFFICANLFCSVTPELTDYYIVQEKKCISSTAADSTKISKNTKKLIISHRGNSTRFPENSIPAFDATVRSKSDYMEFDVMMSYDFVPVIMHDLTLGRTTNVESLFGSDKYVNELTAAQIKELHIDGGYGWSDIFLDSLRVPTFEEIIAKYGDSIGLMINIKDFRQQNIDKIIEILDKRIKDPSKILLETNDVYGVNTTKYNRWCLLSFEKFNEFFNGRDCSCSSSIIALQYHNPTENDKNIKFIQERGGKVLLWTVTAAHQLKQVVQNSNVDGVVTDNTDLAIQYNK